MTITWNGRKLNAAMELALMRGLYIAGLRVKDSAQDSILQGQKSGRVYFRRSVTHQASAPGEPPASDIGKLVQSFDVIPYPTIHTVIISNDAKYAAALEYGTQHIEPRPYMRPALARNLGAINALIAREIAAVF